MALYCKGKNVISRSKVSSKHPIKSHRNITDKVSVAEGAIIFAHQQKNDEDAKKKVEALKTYVEHSFKLKVKFTKSSIVRFKKYVYPYIVLPDKIMLTPTVADVICSVVAKDATVGKVCQSATGQPATSTLDMRTSTGSLKVRFIYNCVSEDLSKFSILFFLFIRRAAGGG